MTLSPQLFVACVYTPVFGDDGVWDMFLLL